MPAPKTECTELAVGFGILGIEPTTVNPTEVSGLFQDTLDQETYLGFVDEYRSNIRLYRRFYSVGARLKQQHRVLSQSNIGSVRWEGQFQQARTTSLARDLTAANIPISVKATSNVVFNRSPHTFFVSRPSGTASETKSENWFLALSPQSYQHLYTFVRNSSTEDLPEQVTDYHIKTTEVQRKSFGKLSASLPPDEQRQFNELYWTLCREVAEKSSAIFNEALKKSLSGKQKNSVIEYMVRDLFRMSDSEYILCGLDRNKEFAVAIPSLTTWRQSWSVRSLVAAPDLTAKQSKVNIVLEIRNVGERTDHLLAFHVEIRWSHGKFNGSPEAKVYKDFRWLDIPFFEDLM